MITEKPVYSNMTSLPDSVLAVVSYMFKNREERWFLEVGLYEGETSAKLLNILDKDFDRLYGIDLSLQKKYIERFNLVFEDNSGVLSSDICSKLLVYQMSSRDGLIKLIAKNGYEYFDFIFVDACHNASHTLEDCVLSWQLLKVGGLMVIDDYEITDKYWEKCADSRAYPWIDHEYYVKGKIAIDGFLAAYKNQFDIVIKGYQIGIVKKVDLN